MADQVGARLATNTADKALAFYSLHAIIAVEFTIADPNDGGMLDVVGFDASAPQLIGEFAAGKI